MRQYIILKSCFLGAKDAVVKLNDRQSPNLIAGGFVEELKKVDKKVKK